jgi:hypothetical protein
VSKGSEKYEMPTAVDAVAGFLARHGFHGLAGALQKHGPVAVAEVLRRDFFAEPKQSACIAACEALARGDLRDPADHHDLLAAIDRLTRERDEARDWVRRLTRVDRVLTCVYCGQAYPPGSPDHGADVLTAHVRVCEKHPMREVETEAKRLRCDLDNALHIAEDLSKIVPYALRACDEARTKTTTQQTQEYARVLREALRRAVHHLGTAAPVNDEDSLVAWDDYHAAKMLVGCTDDVWDDEAAERGMRRIRREALGVESDERPRASEKDDAP